MGAEQSNVSMNSVQLNESKMKHKSNLKINEFSWIPSIRKFKINIEDNKISNNIDKLYIDHRPKISIIEESDTCFLQVVKIVAQCISYELMESSILDSFQVSFNYIYFFINNYLKIKERYNFQDVQSVISKFGICSKNKYPTLNLDKKIDDVLLYNSYCFRHIQFKNIDLSEIKSKLKEGKLILCGLDIYNNFYNTKDNPLLETIENSHLIGGMACLIVGFIEKDKKYIVLVNRGSSWGSEGFIYISYEVFNKLNTELYYINLREDLIRLDIINKDNTNSLSMNNKKDKDIDIDIPKKDTNYTIDIY